MKVVFSNRSRARLHEIRAYITFFNSQAAARVVVDRIIYAVEMLEDHPHLGPPWRKGPTRALVIPGIPYRLHLDAVEIITINHVRQKPRGCRCRGFRLQGTVPLLHPFQCRIGT